MDRPLVADVVLGARADASLSVLALARALGISRNTLTNWESGRTEPTVTQFVALAVACGMRPSALMRRLEG